MGLGIIAQKRIFHEESGRHRMEIVNQQNDLLGLIYFCDETGKYIANLREVDGWISKEDAEGVRKKLPEIVRKLRAMDAERTAQSKTE